MRLRLFIVAVASGAIAVVMAILLSANVADAETVRCSTQASNDTNAIIHFSLEYNIQSSFSVRFDPDPNNYQYSQEGAWQNGAIFHYDTALIAPWPNVTISVIQTGGSFRRSSCSMWVNWVEPPINQGPSPGVAYWPVDEETKALMRQWEASAIQWGINLGAATGTLTFFSMIPGAAPYIAPWRNLLTVMASATAYKAYEYHNLAIDPFDPNCNEGYSPPQPSAGDLGLEYSDGSDPDGSGYFPYLQNSVVEYSRLNAMYLDGAYVSMNRFYSCGNDWQRDWAATYLQYAGYTAETLADLHANATYYLRQTPVWTQEIDDQLWWGQEWHRWQARELQAR